MSAAPNLVLYDDACSLCSFQMRVISWLDWFGVIGFLPISSPRVAEVAPQLSPEALQEAIHCLDRHGRITRGARCIRFVSLRLPLAVPIGLVLWIPGVIWIAEIIYRMISRNRHVLSRLFGCQGACTLVPMRNRAPESPAKRG